MPNENDNNYLDDLSIEEINELYSDIIEFPENVRFAANWTMVPGSGRYSVDCGK